jgi:hypothetical protein
MLVGAMSLSEWVPLTKHQLERSIRKGIARVGAEAAAAQGAVGVRDEHDGNLADAFSVESTAQAQRLSELELRLHLKVDIIYL